MDQDDARLLLKHIGVLRRRCDLDLLIFFANHPRAILTSESLASFLGYDLGEIAESLETLLGAGLLTRQQTPAHAARMYVFAAGDPPGGWLPRLLRLAATRKGRLALREALARRSSPAAEDAEARVVQGLPARSGPRRLAG